MEQAKHGASKTPSKPPPSLRSYTSAEREKDLREGVAQHPGSITRLTALVNFLRREKRDREAIPMLLRLILLAPQSDLSHSRARAWFSVAEAFERIAGFNPSGVNENDSWSLLDPSPREGVMALERARKMTWRAILAWPKDREQLRGYLRLYEHYLLLLRVLGHHTSLRACEVHLDGLRAHVAENGL